MIIPVRCFTCNKLTAQNWTEYVERVSGGEEPAAILDAMGYTRYCCRRMFLSNVDLTEMLHVNTLHSTPGEAAETTDLPREEPSAA